MEDRVALLIDLAQIDPRVSEELLKELEVSGVSCNEKGRALALQLGVGVDLWLAHEVPSYVICVLLGDRKVKGCLKGLRHLVVQVGAGLHQELDGLEQI